MITCSAWAGKRYAVLGLARSGAATVASLVASGASVVAWDEDEERRSKLLPRQGEVARRSRDGGGGRPTVSQSSPSTTAPSGAAVPLPLAGEELVIAPLDTLDLSIFDALVLSPGVPLNTHPLAARARAAGVPIIGDIELFAQARVELPPHKVVGITGTNGKSTTTALVHHILQTAGVPSLMGGNIGLPVLGQEPLPEGGVYVLELSSYQIDLTRTLDCNVAVLLNITPDHLDRYDGFAEYTASKLRLFRMQSSTSHVVSTEHGYVDLTPLSEMIDDIVAITRCYVHPVSSNVTVDRGAALVAGVAMIDGKAFSRQENWPALRGPHNAQNALAAMTVCRLLGVNPIQVDLALRTFTGLPHRMQRVAERGGVAYVNDSKATNPDSVAPALAAFARVHWILGGRAKGDDLDACRPHFPHVARAYTIGEAGPVFAALLRREAVPVEEAGTLARAVASAAAQAKAGDTVLLSPAAASFDQFRDFEARGDAFRTLVEALA